MFLNCPVDFKTKVYILHTYGNLYICLFATWWLLLKASLIITGLLLLAFSVEDTWIIIMPDWDLQQLIHIMILTRRSRSAQHTAGVQAAQVFLFIVNSIMIVRHLTQVQYNLYGPSSPPPCYHQTILAKYFLPVCRDRSASRLQAPGSALQHEQVNFWKYRRAF